MPVQNNNPSPDLQTAPNPAPILADPSKTPFAFTSAKRAVSQVFTHLKNLGELATESRQKTAEAREDKFINHDALNETSQKDLDEANFDKSKSIKRSHEQAAQKLEKALNALTPASFQFAFNVVLYKHPELFDKYLQTGAQTQDSGKNQADAEFRKATVIARSQDLGPVVTTMIKDKLAENDKKPASKRISQEEQDDLEALLSFFPGDGEQVDTAALVEYYKNNHAELPKDIRNLFDKNLQKTIAEASKAKDVYENRVNNPDLNKLPEEYTGAPGERAWLNKLLTASSGVGEFYNYTVDEAMETFNPQPWQPNFAISYPIVSLVRGARPGFDGADAKYLMTPTQGYVNQALTSDVPSPRFMVLEGAELNT